MMKKYSVLELLAVGLIGYYVGCFDMKYKAFKRIAERKNDKEDSE